MHGSTEHAEWTWPAFHPTGLILAHLEPDLDITWDRAQHAATAEIMDEMLQAVTAMRQPPS